MEKFKKGDRVVCLESTSVFRPAVGTIGIVLDGDAGNKDCLVQWPKDSTSAQERRDHWFCQWNFLTKAKSSSIHITADGTTTRAVLKENGKVTKRSEAKCAPGDTYDFAIGAQIALDRLVGTQEPKRKAVRVFDRFQYIKDRGWEAYQCHHSWVDDCHGNAVNDDGFVYANGICYKAPVEQTIERELPE